MIWLLETTLKMSLVLVIGLAASIAVRQRSAALRHWVIAAAIFCAGSLPVLGLVAPSWSLPQGSLVTRGSVAEISITADDPSTSGGRLEPGQPMHQRVPTLTRLSDLVVPIWVLGAAVNLLILLVAMIRLTRIAGRAAPVRAAAWTTWLVRVSEALGVSRSVSVLQSDRPALLVTWGLVSSRVLLPIDAGDWSEERIRVVLAHELAHVVRGDWIVQTAAEILRASTGSTRCSGARAAACDTRASMHATTP